MRDHAVGNDQGSGTVRVVRLGLGWTPLRQYRRDRESSSDRGNSSS